jgi:hypothetical protein
MRSLSGLSALINGRWWAGIPTLGPVKSSGTLQRDLLALGALCALTFFVGLTTHGLTNWQEAQRALVARDMAHRGDWLVPTIHAEPYLAKPPMIYWAQLSLARLRGSEPGVQDLRLTVAIAATLGVFATYFAGRRILADVLPADADPATARLGAFWAAAMLGTGALYVRSGRIGELDILLVPLVVVAVGCVGWKRSEIRDQRSGSGGGGAGTAAPATTGVSGWRGARGPLSSILRSLVSLLPAALAATGAALTKGPPGLLVIALAAYFPAILIHRRGGEATERERSRGGSAAEEGGGKAAAPVHSSVGVLGASVAPTGPAGVIGAVVGLVVAGLATVFISGAPESVGEGLGAVLLAGGMAWVGAVVAGADWRRVIGEWWRTNPVVVLGLPLVALWVWGRLVGGRIGAEAVSRAAGVEASENLRIWVLESPLRTLGGASYGVGLGSVLAVATGLWLIRARPRLGPGWAILLGWTVVSLLAFSALGKGPARYLTPIWPGIALVAGLGVALAAGSKFKTRSSKLRSGEERPLLGLFAFRLSLFALSARRLRILLGVLVITLGVAQGLWYGYGREALYSWRSPRDLVAEIMRPELNPEQRPPLALDIWTPALDYYTGAHVQPYFSGGPSVALAGVRPRPLEALRDELEAAADAGESPWRIILIRAAPHPEGPPTPPIERLQLAGLMVQTLPVEAKLRIDNNRTEVIAVRVAPAPIP